MKKILALLSAMAVMLSLCACNGSTTEAESEGQEIDTAESEAVLDEIDDTIDEIDDYTPAESMLYDVELYSDRRLTVKLVELSSDAITFSVSNTSDTYFILTLDVALDGQCISGYSEYQEFGAGETADLTFYCDLSCVSHKYLSMAGTIFVEGTTAITFRTCNVDIGGEENYEYTEYTYESGVLLYSSDDLVVEFINPDSTGLNIKITNNMDVETSPYFDDLFINGDTDFNYNYQTCTVPPCSTIIFHVPTLEANYDYFASDVEYISGSVVFFTDQIGYTDEFEFDSRTTFSAPDPKSESKTESDINDIEDVEDYESTSIEKIMSDFVGAFSTPPTVTGPVEEDGVVAYSIEREGSTFYIFYNPDNDGSSTIGILPVELDSDKGASTWMVVVGEMIYVVDPEITLEYDAISLFSSIYDGGTRTNGDIEYEFSTDTFLFTITF